MASVAFTARGGTEPEYKVYQALFATGRKETGDFVFKPAGQLSLSFAVYSPNVGIKVGQANEADRLLFRSAGQRVEVIDNQRALSDARGALSEALGGN